MEDLKDASYRTLVLDSEVIPILTDFLLNCDESKQVAILCSLDWLNHFIDFFREDFLAVVDRARSTYLASNPNRPNNPNSTNAPGIEEESKEPAIVEETKSSVGAGNLLQIDTTGGAAAISSAIESNNNRAGGASSNNLDLNDLRKNKT